MADLERVRLGVVPGQRTVRDHREVVRIPDPRRQCLEEIKTIRGHPDEIPENHQALHWAQLQTYGALFCRARGVDEVHLALVYVDVATQGETVLRQLCSAEQLEAAFEQRCEAFLAWSQQEAADNVGVPLTTVQARWRAAKVRLALAGLSAPDLC